MHELKIVNMLRDGLTLDQLKSDHKIKHNRHKKYNNLVLLDYMPDASFTQEISHECRGLILDESDNWNVVSYPFKKFFNFFEVFKADLDEKTTKFYEKLDGTLIVLYYYNEWLISTSGTADASGNVCSPVFDVGLDCDYSKLFWDLWGKFKYSLPEEKNKCYMFELCTKHNQVIIEYKDPKIVFLGVRNLDTLKEEKIEPIAEKYGWEIPSLYDFESIEKAIYYCSSTDKKIEGVIAVDDNFNRLKIKTSIYATTFKTICGSDSSVKSLVVFWEKDGKLNDLLTEFEDVNKVITDKYEIVVKAIDIFIRECEKDYEKINGLPIEEFRKEAAKTIFPDCMFKMKKGLFSDPRDYVKRNKWNQNGLYKAVFSSPRVLQHLSV